MRKSGYRFSGAIAFTQIAVTYLRSRSDIAKMITFMNWIESIQFIAIYKLHIHSTPRRRRNAFAVLILGLK
jgi:hypothetical protein